MTTLSPPRLAPPIELPSPQRSSVPAEWLSGVPTSSPKSSNATFAKALRYVASRNSPKQVKDISLPMRDDGGIGFSPERNGVIRSPVPAHHSVYPEVLRTRRLSASPFKQDATFLTTSPRSEPPTMRLSYMQRPLPSPPKDASAKISFSVPSPGGSDTMRTVSPLAPSTPLSPVMASRRSSGLDMSLQAELVSQLSRRSSDRRGAPQPVITPTTIVNLDIGGRVYKTTWNTLNAVPSYFSELFHRELKNTTATFFIDRAPGDHIDTILTYLRYKADGVGAPSPSTAQSTMTTPRHSQESFLEWFSPAAVPTRFDESLKDTLNLHKSPDFLRVLIAECRYYGLRELKMIASDCLEEGEQIQQQYGTWRCVKLRVEEVSSRATTAVKVPNSSCSVNNDRIPVTSSLSLRTVSRSPSPSPYLSSNLCAFASDTENDDDYNSETSLEDAIDATVDGIKAQLIRRRNALMPKDKATVDDAKGANDIAKVPRHDDDETTDSQDETQDILAWYDAVSVTPRVDTDANADEVFMLIRFRQ